MIGPGNAVYPASTPLPFDPTSVSTGAILEYLLKTDDVIGDFVNRVSVNLSDGWAESVAAESRSITPVCRMASVLRFVLLSWKNTHSANAPLSSNLIYPTLYSREDALAVARSVQASLDDSVKPLLHYDSKTDVWYNREHLPTGEFKYTPFIPSSAPSLQRVIIADAHRACGHRGVDLTLAGISDWSLHHPHKRTSTYISACIHCQCKRAKRGTNSDLLMNSDLSVIGPFQSIAMDHLNIGPHSHCLSIMCLKTGFILLSYCSSLSAADTWNAFLSALYRMPRRPSIIRTDKATHIFNKVISTYQDKFKIAVEYRPSPPSSQWENGALERQHGSVLSVLRSTMLLSSLCLPKMEDCAPHDVQLLLDAVSFILNARPLHEVHIDPTTCQRVVISPSYLVYGAGIYDGIFDGSTPAPPPPRPFKSNYADWRSFYDQFYWKRLKARSAKAIAKRSKSIQFCINELVLFYSPSASKSGIDFQVGRIIDIKGNHLILRRNGKRDTTISVHNACKLTLSESTDGTSTVNRVGARVCMRVEGIEYFGTVKEEEVGLLLITWDWVQGTAWPDEWREPNELTFVT